MKLKQSFSIIKQPVTLILIIAVIVLGSSTFLLSQNKNQSNKTLTTNVEQTSHSEDNSETPENPLYGHVHSLFLNSSTNTLLMGTHHGLFKSTDQGKTFKKVEVKGDVKAMDFMNFAYDQDNKIIYAGGHDLGVVKSTDRGATWEKADSGITGTDIHALAINPLETNRIYAFSVDNGVFGTKDGGKSWNRIDDGPANPGVRAFGYMATPSSMDRGMKTDKTTNIGYLWAGTGGGLYSSFACFCGWTKTSGISDNATIYTLAPDPVNRPSMFAGTKDGIYKTTDEGKTFTKVSDAINIAAIAFDEADPKVLFAATSNGILYRSDDNGANWSRVQ